MDAEAVRAMLRAECEKAGSMLLFSMANDMTYECVRATLKGLREPGPKILRALKLKRTQSYIYSVDEKANVR